MSRRIARDFPAVSRAVRSLVCLCLLSVGAARGGEGAPADPEIPTKGLPADVAVYFETCEVSALDKLYNPFTESFFRENLLGNPLDLYARKNGAADDDAPMVGLYLATLLKVPPEKYAWYFDSSRPIRYALCCAAAPGNKRLGAWLLPLVRMEQLVDFWSGQKLTRDEGLEFKVLQKGDEEGKPLLAELSFPREMRLYLLCLGAKGTVMAPDRESAEHLAGVFAAWPAERHEGGHLAVTLDFAKLREREGGVPEFLRPETRQKQHENRNCPLVLQSLFLLPQTGRQSLETAVAGCRLARLDAYLNSPIVVRLALYADAGGETEKFTAALAALGTGRTELLDAQPRDSVLLCHLPNAGAMKEQLRAALEPVLLAERLPAGDDEARTLRRAMLHDLLAACGGEACLSLSRGTDQRIGTLVCLESAGDKAGTELLANLKPYLGPEFAVAFGGDFIYLGFGPDAGRLVAEARTAVAEKAKRLGARPELAKVYAGVKSRQFAFVSAYPVDLAKAMLGELALLASRVGVPFGGARILKGLHEKAADSRTPATLSVGARPGAVEAVFSLPQESIFEVGNLLQESLYLANEFDDQLEESLMNQQIERLKQRCPEIREILKDTPEREQPAE